MSYRFEREKERQREREREREEGRERGERGERERERIDTVLRFYMHGNVSAINHNYGIVCRCVCREISLREFIERDITSASVEPSQECNQSVWQIVYMPCANPILRSTIPVDGSASATSRDTTQYARSQAWRRLNSAGSASFWRLSLVALGWW